MLMRRNIHGNRRASPGNKFNGNFASLFPGAYLIVQTDLGLTYGATPVASGTTPPVATLSGTLATTPVPIWFKCTTPGVINGTAAVFAAYADGLGVTPFQTGIQPNAGVPVALNAPCSGLSIAWAAGTAALDNVWKATCSALADQSGNNQNLVQAAAGQQPVLGTGLNGFASVIGDGVDDSLNCDTLNMPAPGTTPYYIFGVFRCLTTTGNPMILGNGDSTTANFLYPPSAALVRTFNGSANVDASCTPTQWNIAEIKRSNNAADTIKIGANTGTGNAGNSSFLRLRVFSSPGGSINGNHEMLALVYTPNFPNWAAVRAAVTAKYLTVNV